MLYTKQLISGRDINMKEHLLGVIRQPIVDDFMGEYEFQDFLEVFLNGFVIFVQNTIFPSFTNSVVFTCTFINLPLYSITISYGLLSPIGVNTVIPFLTNSAIRICSPIIPIPFVFEDMFSPFL